MTWLLAIVRTVYYLLLPFITVLGWLLVLLAPVGHLGNYLLSGMLLPVTLLAKFETLYIYLGVAAVIGLVTGSILHLSSTLLISMLNLSPLPEETQRSAASVRAAREQKKLEDAWQSSAVESDQPRWKVDISMEAKHGDWSEKDATKRREDHGLLGQTIIEEDDDSEGGF